MKTFQPRLCRRGSRRWRVVLYDRGLLPENTRLAATYSKASLMAQVWCDKPGKTATIWNRHTNSVKTRYWRDVVGLQYIDYA